MPEQTQTLKIGRVATNAAPTCLRLQHLASATLHVAKAISISLATGREDIAETTFMAQTNTPVLQVSHPL